MIEFYQKKVIKFITCFQGEKLISYNSLKRQMINMNESYLEGLRTNLT